MASKGIVGAFARAVEDGEIRLNRTWPQLFATGMVGGLDVGLGVFALLLVLEDTGNHLLGALAFTIGFIAVGLGRSELFTENFFVPIAAVAAKRRGWPAVARLWGGSVVTNLIGGWVIAAIIIAGYPSLRGDAIDLGAHFIELGIGSRSFATGLLAGVIITLMTWMQQSSESVVAKLAAAVSAGFLLGYGEVNHAVVLSIEMFAGIRAGADYGYLDWLRVFGWASLANMVGGIGLVTTMRLLQVRSGENGVDGDTLEELSEPQPEPDEA